MIVVTIKVFKTINFYFDLLCVASQANDTSLKARILTINWSRYLDRWMKDLDVFHMLNNMVSSDFIIDESFYYRKNFFQN